MPCAVIGGISPAMARSSVVLPTPLRRQADPRAVRNARGGAFQQQLASDPQCDVVDHEHARYLADRTAAQWLEP
jgi:hypothetical protein